MNRRSFITAVSALCAAPLAWVGLKKRDPFATFEDYERAIAEVSGWRESDAMSFGGKVFTFDTYDESGMALIPNIPASYTIEGPGTYWVDQGNGPEYVTLKEGEVRTYDNRPETGNTFTLEDGA